MNTAVIQPAPAHRTALRAPSSGIAALWLAAWMAGSAAAQNNPVPRAVPVTPGTPVPRATVVEDDDPRRSGPDEDLFAYGTMLYERGEFALAARSYSDYVNTYPSGAHAATALFRIGESLIKQGMEAQSEPYFLQVVQRYPKSEGAASAAYRLGAMRFNSRDFEESIRFFQFCEQHAKIPQVALAAAYNLSRAYQMNGDTKRQIEALQRVAAVAADNPYREEALLQLGRAELRGDKSDSALERFLALRDSASTPENKAEASLNAAVLLAERKEADRAATLFEEVLSIPEARPEWRGIALVGVVQALYDRGDFDAVIDHYARNASVLPDGKTRAKMLLLVGNSYRMKKMYARAVELYLMAERDHPEDTAAFEAGYWKLYCFYLLEDRDLGDFAADFLKRWAETKSDHEFVANARLILADFHFNQRDYPRAADAFRDVSMPALSADLRASALYNKGYSELESERHQDAINTISTFLNDFPRHEMVPNALAYRGMAHRAAKDNRKAEEDFKKITADYPKSPAAELAWGELGLIAVAERDHAATVRAFENLLKFFPQTAAAPRAAFSIGVAAFEMEDWARAQEALRRAIRLDSQSYLDRASEMLIISYYGQEDSAGLASAIDEYRGRRKDAPIPPNVLGWLGLTLFADGEFAAVDKYLSMATDPEDPGSTLPVLWNYLGMARVETGAYPSAITALNNYLSATPNPGAERGKALLYRARAELGLGEHDTAIATCEEALTFVKTGRLNAEILILEGDVHFDRAEKLAAAGKAIPARDEYLEAAKRYVNPANLFEDPKITPEALWKAATAMSKAGDEQRAEPYLKRLQDNYPSFRPKAG
jgi:TolA-binding protein